MILYSREVVGDVAGENVLRAAPCVASNNHTLRELYAGRIVNFKRLILRGIFEATFP